MSIHEFPDRMSQVQQEKTEHSLDVLDAMAEAWAESVNLATMVASIPNGLPTPEFQQRARDSIAAMIKQVYVEGLYEGLCSSPDAESSGRAPS